MWTLYRLTSKAISLYEIAILIRVLSSWVNFSPGNSFINFIYEITDPLLNAIKDILYNKLNLRTGMIDISPIVAFFILRVISDVVFKAAVRF